MSEINCYLCGSKEKKCLPGKVRDNDLLQILECTNCGLVYLSDMSHVSDEHYAESGMHDNKKYDINEWLKRSRPDDERRYSLLKSRIENNTVLDFGCGAGGFIELARTHSKTIVGIEVERALMGSYKDRGLTVYEDLERAINAGNKWSLITAFHVVEHLKDPINVIVNMSSLLSDDGEIVLEVPNADDALLSVYDSPKFREFTYWSQHLYTFRRKTLELMVKKAGFMVNWVKFVQRYPLSNHLYWLSEGKPGGHLKWDYLINKRANDEYESNMASLGITDTIMMSIKPIT